MRAVGVLVVACALGAACTRAPSTREHVEVALAGETMGSTWLVKLRVPDDAAAVARARGMQAPIEELLERANDLMSTYRPTSEVSRFNAHASAAPFPVSTETALVVAKALEVGRATGGAFDITLDPLIDLWGFDRRGPRDAPPSAAEIAEARAHTGLHLVAVEAGALVKRDPLVRINLGGIASGWAVDEVAKLCAARGFTDFMIEVTGEVRARGLSARGAPWRIGVKVPDLHDPGVVATVALDPDGQALTTSGSYHNFFEATDASGARKRYHHVLDPMTGAPADTRLVSVTVLHADALTADAYDTPFLILGEARAREIVARTPGMAALFLTADDAGRVTAASTPGFPELAPRR